MTTVLNGWSVDAITEAVEAVRQQPDAGKVTWRGAVTHPVSIETAVVRLR